MRIAVIGGGVGGLSAARALVKAGIDAHVLEAATRAGGVVTTSSVDGYVREHAASSFLGGPPRGGYALCKELGVAVDKASPAAKHRWVYIDGKLRAVPSSPFALVTSDLLTWHGKLDLLREPLRPRRTGGDESMHAFAARRLGAEAARALIAPFVTGVYGADSHDISLEAGFPKLAALDAEGGLLRGMLVQMGRSMLARARGLPNDATPRGMYAPHGGLGALVAALAHELGPRVHLGRRVGKLEPVAGGVAVDGERWDGCVLATAAEDAVGITSSSELAARLGVFHRAPTALVYLGYPAEMVPRGASGFGFLVAQGEDVRVLGVVFESTVWPERAPAGHVLMRCIYGGGRDPEAVELDDAALIAQAMRDVTKVLDARGTPSHASVVRWKRGVAQYRIGHKDRVREAITCARSMRIALAGADYRGAGINDLCADAEAVVAEVTGW